MDVTLHRIDPVRNAFRFYRFALWPDLFGGVSLAREWGRFGQPGKLRLDTHESAEEACRALARLSRVKPLPWIPGGPMSEGMRLHDAQGRRKYLTDPKRKAFLAAAGKAPRPVRTLCLVLAYTGCRITEALNLSASRIDIEAGQIVFESLKKRRRGLYRVVPVPEGEAVIEALDLVHGLREAQKGRDGGAARACGDSRALLLGAMSISPRDKHPDDDAA